LETISSKNSGVIFPTYILQDIAICGLDELPELLLTFIGPSQLLLFLKNISVFPGVVSIHTIYTLLPATTTFFCWPASVMVLLRLVFVLSDGEAPAGVAADVDCPEIENTHDEIIINDKSIIVMYCAH
jgi:hypothetical protein